MTLLQIPNAEGADADEFHIEVVEESVSGQPGGLGWTGWTNYAPVNELEIVGSNCGLLSVQGQVMLRFPGAPYRDTSLLFFTEDDLNNAITLGLLQKASVVGSYSWVWSVLKKAQ